MKNFGGGGNRDALRDNVASFCPKVENVIIDGDGVDSVVKVRGVPKPATIIDEADRLVQVNICLREQMFTSSFLLSSTSLNSEQCQLK
jgi:hypothetical protein